MCNCIQKTNKLLAERNTMLDTKMSINFETGKTRSVFMVPTKKINSRGAKATLVRANFCPLCGEAQDNG